MIDLEGTFLDKARESLSDARAELDARRFSNSANRSYYATFQAAIHAILAESIRPPRPDNWDHGWVQSQFNVSDQDRRRAKGQGITPSRAYL